MTTKHVVSTTFTYGVRDRVDVSNFCDDVDIPDITTIQLDNLLPTSTDENSIRNNFSVLVGRVLCKYVPFFKNYGKGLERHILHEHLREMSQKSEVVSSELNWCA